MKRLTKVRSQQHVSPGGEYVEANDSIHCCEVFEASFLQIEGKHKFQCLEQCLINLILEAYRRSPAGKQSYGLQLCHLFNYA